MADIRKKQTKNINTNSKGLEEFSKNLAKATEELNKNIGVFKETAKEISSLGSANKDLISLVKTLNDKLKTVALSEREKLPTIGQLKARATAGIIETDNKLKVTKSTKSLETKKAKDQITKIITTSQAQKDLWVVKDKVQEKALDRKLIGDESTKEVLTTRTNLSKSEAEHKHKLDIEKSNDALAKQIELLKVKNDYLKEAEEIKKSSKISQELETSNISKGTIDYSSQATINTQKEIFKLEAEENKKRRKEAEKERQTALALKFGSLTNPLDDGVISQSGVGKIRNMLNTSRDIYYSSLGVKGKAENFIHSSTEGLGLGKGIDYISSRKSLLNKSTHREKILTALAGMDDLENKVDSEGVVTGKKEIHPKIKRAITDMLIDTSNNNPSMGIGSLLKEINNKINSSGGYAHKFLDSEEDITNLKKDFGLFSHTMKDSIVNMKLFNKAIKGSAGVGTALTLGAITHMLNVSAFSNLQSFGQGYISDYKQKAEYDKAVTTAYTDVITTGLVALGGAFFGVGGATVGYGLGSVIGSVGNYISSTNTKDYTKSAIEIIGSTFYGRDLVLPDSPNSYDGESSISVLNTELKYGLGRTSEKQFSNLVEAGNLLASEDVTDSFLTKMYGSGSINEKARKYINTNYKGIFERDKTQMPLAKAILKEYGEKVNNMTGVARIEASNYLSAANSYMLSGEDSYMSLNKAKYEGIITSHFVGSLEKLDAVRTSAEIFKDMGVSPSNYGSPIKAHNENIRNLYSSRVTGISLDLAKEVAKGEMFKGAVAPIYKALEPISLSSMSIGNSESFVKSFTELSKSSPLMHKSLANHMNSNFIDRTVTNSILSSFSGGKIANANTFAEEVNSGKFSKDDILEMVGGEKGLELLQVVDSEAYNLVRSAINGDRIEDALEVEKNSRDILEQILETLKSQADKNSNDPLLAYVNATTNKLKGDK